MSRRSQQILRVFKEDLLPIHTGHDGEYLSTDGETPEWIPIGPHTHDGETLQIDGINSDGGAFAFTTSGILTFSNQINIGTLNAGVADYDKFLVSDGGLIKFRTGAQVRSDIGAEAAGISVLETDFNADTFLYATLNNTPVATSPANVLAALSGHAAAAFDWNGQSLTGIDNITLADESWIGIGAAAERIVFDTTGDIEILGADFGIGVAPGGKRLYVYDPMTDPGATSESVFLYTNITASASAHTDWTRGTNIQLSLGGTQNHTGSFNRVLSGAFYNTGSGTVTNATAMLFTAGCNSTGGITNLELLKLNTYGAGAGAIGTIYGLQIASLSAYHTPTNTYGIDISANAVATGTNKYGIRIGNLSGATNNFSIHTGTAKSYFGGSVGIITTNPGQALDVNQGSGNMIADGYDTHSLRCYKENIKSVAAHGMIERLKAFNLYEFTKKPHVSADELRELTIKKFGKERWIVAFGGEIIEEFIEDPETGEVSYTGETTIDRDEYRGGKMYDCPDAEMLKYIDKTATAKRAKLRKLPKWQRKHLGLIADDADTVANAGDVISRNDDGEIVGYSISDYTSFLHGVMLELINKVTKLEEAIAHG